MTYLSELGASQNQNLTPSLTGNQQVMGKEDFLKLLVTQLQHQDPMNPSDPTEFTAQLAQFSSLEQLFSVNKNLDQLGKLEQMSALSMLGTEVVSQGQAFRLSAGDSVEIGYRLDNVANEVTLHVRDEFGRTVASIEADKAAGEHFLTWDGTDYSGQVAPPGNYSFFVSATGPDDEVISATPLVKGKVSGVDLDEQGHILITNAGEFRLDSIKNVRAF